MAMQVSLNADVSNNERIQLTAHKTTSPIISIVAVNLTVTYRRNPEIFKKLT
jgi:hypothetical protein